MTWKVGDWVIFDLSIGQIKRMGDFEEFSDGSFATSGRLADRFRPLTLRGKSIIEYFDHYYRALNNIEGHAGFNFPDIFQHFSQLARDAIDDEAAQKDYLEKAKDFFGEARDYKPIIQGISLFRPNPRKANA